MRGPNNWHPQVRRWAGSACPGCSVGSMPPAVSSGLYHVVMATLLSLDDHLAALVRSGAGLGEAAAAAGLEAKVPTCPAWDVTDLLVHQGMVHRWAAANLRGDRDHDTAASQAEGKAAASLLDWYTRGLAALVDTVRATAADAKAMVFLPGTRRRPGGSGLAARRMRPPSTASTRSRPAPSGGRPPPTSPSIRCWLPMGSTSC